MHTIILVDAFHSCELFGKKEKTLTAKENIHFECVNEHFARVTCLKKHISFL